MSDAWGGSWGASWGLSWTRSTVTPPAVVQQVSGGFWPRSFRKKIEEPEEAVALIEAQGTQQEQQRAESIAPLLHKLEHAKAQLDAEQKRRARAEAKWAMAVAQRIQRDRDDEEVAVALLLLH